MAIHLIGDLHGHYRDYERLLMASGLCDRNLRWTGGHDTVWLMGDFFDRGASGIRCMDLTMQLQNEAREAGGELNSLLGNHELMILCAYRFRERAHHDGLSIYDHWLRWGGIEADFEGFNDTHAEWIRTLPAMVNLKTEGQSALMIHADAMLYVNHGLTIEAVNQSFRELMASDDLPRWMSVLSSFSEHMAFSGLEITGRKRADQLLSLYGGDLVVHGHTPIPYARQIDAETVTEAWSYAGGRCLNVDGGMYMGSPGFIHTLAD